jgi:hypothetical protein
MPNRILRSGFLDSDKVNSISDAAQNFFVRLILVADDFGRFDARPEVLRSSCYPLSDICLTTVSQLLAKNIQAGLVLSYSILGKNYLLIPSFNQRLRKMKSRFPEPPEDIENNTITTNGGPLSGSCQSSNGLNPNPNPNPKQKRKEALKPFGEFVKITDVEYEKLILKYGHVFTDTAIREYGRKIGIGGTAAAKHKNHYLGMIDYIERGYICQGETKEPGKRLEVK